MLDMRHSFKHGVMADATFVLFDGFQEGEFLYSPYMHHVGILGDVSDKEVRWFQNDWQPGGNSYYKENNDMVFPPERFQVRKMQKLDDIVAERGFPLPDLVKIDVQGCERDVLMGGRKTLTNARDLIIEMQHVDYNRGAPKVFETAPYIESMGFRCVAPLFCNNGPDGDYHFVRV